MLVCSTNMSDCLALTIAIVGPTGFIGSIITPTFVKAAKDGEIAQLRLLTTDVKKPKIQKYVEDGGEQVEAFGINYDQPSTLEDALRGVNVLVSVMGAEGDYSKRKTVLLDAACQSGVEVYFPSEWGTNHNRTKRYHPIFEAKSHHHHDAEARGLKVVAVYTGLIIEFCFCKWFGVDSAKNTWVIPGTGNEPCAMTSSADLGPYSLRAVLLSHNEPDRMPSQLEIYSDKGTWNSYADAMEKVSGNPIRRQYLSLEQAVKNYDAVKDTLPPHMLGPFLPILTAENAFDHSEDGIKVLNPDHKFFKPKTVAEYALEVDGKPWLNSSPFG